MLLIKRDIYIWGYSPLDRIFGNNQNKSYRVWTCPSCRVIESSYVVCLCIVYNILPNKNVKSKYTFRYNIVNIHGYAAEIYWNSSFSKCSIIAFDLYSIRAMMKTKQQHVMKRTSYCYRIGVTCILQIWFTKLSMKMRRHFWKT